MTISAFALAKLEQKVRSLMAQGRFQEAIQEVRSMASVYGESSNELARKVAELALELGHAQPLRQEPIEGQLVD